MPVNGVAVTSVGAGIVFVYSGIKGWSVMATMRDLVSGKKPSQSVANAIPSDSGTGSVATGATGNTGNALADAMIKGIGHAYVYGGAPGATGANPWDCSSDVNFTASSIGLAIPGYGPGKYDGTVHGPPTGSWLIWPGLKRVPVSQAQAGDVVIFAAHMGVCVSNTEMVSALNPAMGTQKTNIFGGVLRCGRYG